MKYAAAIALAAILATVGLAGSAEAGSKSPTKLNIRGQQGDYFGFVKSDNVDCTSMRKVKVFKMKGSSPAPKTDRKIGTDVSDDVELKSKWSIGTSGFKHGKFYAKVGKTDVCRGKTSKVISR